MTDLIHHYQPIAAAITALLPGEIEVVIHDLRTGQVAHMENPLSARAIGTESLVETEGLTDSLDEKGIIGPYPKTNSDGSRMKSVTAVLREGEEIVGLLCINMRLNGMEQAISLLNRFIHMPEQADTDALMKHDWREAANRLLGHVLEQRGTNISAAKRADKIAILKELDRAGIFESRGSADYVSQILKISRSSLYELLQQSRTAAE